VPADQYYRLTYMKFLFLLALLAVLATAVFA
jgi:hypothetical protein